MLAYAVVLVITQIMMASVESLTATAALALLPVISVFYGLRVTVKALRILDELQRRIHFEATPFNLIGTALLTFTYGFMEKDGLPSMNWVLPFAVGLWGLGQAIAGRKYK